MLFRSITNTPNSDSVLLGCRNNLTILIGNKLIHFSLLIKLLCRGSIGKHLHIQLGNFDQLSGSSQQFKHLHNVIFIRIDADMHLCSDTINASPLVFDIFHIFNQPFTFGNAAFQSIIVDEKNIVRVSMLSRQIKCSDSKIFTQIFLPVKLITGWIGNVSVTQCSIVVHWFINHIPGKNVIFVMTYHLGNEVFHSSTNQLSFFLIGFFDVSRCFGNFQKRSSCRGFRRFTKNNIIDMECCRSCPEIKNKLILICCRGGSRKFNRCPGCSNRKTSVIVTAIIRILQLNLNCCSDRGFNHEGNTIINSLLQWLVKCINLLCAIGVSSSWVS